MVKEATCFENSKESSFFIYMHFLETGLSRFHNIKVTKTSRKCLIQNNEMALYFIGAIRRLKARNFGQRTIWWMDNDLMKFDINNNQF